MEMADIVWSDVTGFASEQSAVAGPAQTLILAYVNTGLAPARLGGEASARYKLTRTLLAAHLGTMSIRQGSTPAGPVIGESAGGMAVQYGFNIAAAAEDLFSTGYGKEYHSLVRRSPGCRPPLVT